MTSSFLFDFQNFKLEDAAKRSDFFLQKKTALQNEGKAELMLMIIAALIGKASFFCMASKRIHAGHLRELAALLEEQRV